MSAVQSSSSSARILFAAPRAQGREAESNLPPCPRGPRPLPQVRHDDRAAAPRRSRGARCWADDDGGGGGGELLCWCADGADDEAGRASLKGRRGGRVAAPSGEASRKSQTGRDASPLPPARRRSGGVQEPLCPLRRRSFTPSEFWSCRVIQLLSAGSDPADQNQDPSKNWFWWRFRCWFG